MRKPSDELQQLAQIAVRAGAVVMELYGGQVEARLKSDESPVTLADIEAEKIILAGLAACDPKTPVIAEEAVAGGLVPKASERFYLVDPLDGTKEFINQNGEFTVNIGLIENGAPTMGVVFAPAIERLFCGAVGLGAFEARCSVNDDVGDCKWQAISVNPAPQTGAIAVASRSHRDEQTEQWLASHDVCKVVTAGSSLKFCLVAAGQAHLYPRFGRTMEWDTAAGHAVVAAAGGKVVTEQGAPLRYGKEARGFDNPAFFVSG